VAEWVGHTAREVGTLTVAVIEASAVSSVVVPVVAAAAVAAVAGVVAARADHPYQVGWMGMY